jgi:hypothetical protein
VVVDAAIQPDFFDEGAEMASHPEFTIDAENIAMLDRMHLSTDQEEIHISAES